MNEESFSISLRVWHPTLSDESVIEAIGLTPEFRQSAGARRINPSGQPLDGVYRSTYCSFVLVHKAPNVFTDELDNCLSALQTQSDFFQKVAIEGGRSELFIGVFTESSTGFTLNTKTISMISSLFLEISVEIYF